MELDLIAARVAACEGCGLCKTRTQVVPGCGDPSAQIMLIGEGPGEEEDAQGLPFVGRSGELLNKALGNAGLARAEIFITNTVKCRPPDNRNPSEEEMIACSPFLLDQISTVKPELIITLGKVASERVLGEPVRITVQNGRIYFPQSVPPIIVAYHPSYVLRNRNTLIEAAFMEVFIGAKRILGGAK